MVELRRGKALPSDIAEPFDACLDLLRRLPPHKTEENLEALVKLLPEQEEELRNAVDLPTRILLCPKANREFLACDYNKVGQAHRSPWSGLLVTAGQGASEADDTLSERLKAVESLANRAFDSYRQLYYDGGISSVYCWPGEDDKGFGAAVLLKKCVQEAVELAGASWDSIHVVEVVEEEGGSITLSLTSTVLVDLQGDFEGIDAFRMGGSMIRQTQTVLNATSDTDIVAAMGKQIEEVEGRMRSNLQEIYFGKTLEIVNELRPAGLPEGFLRNQGDFREEMKSRLAK